MHNACIVCASWHMCEYMTHDGGGRGPWGAGRYMYTASYTDQVSTFDLSLINLHLKCHTYMKLHVVSVLGRAVSVGR
jgi:hypothetical protein